MRAARSIRIRGVVQGVGFRPFVYRMAQAHSLGGWVLNGEQGVEILVEGTPAELARFSDTLVASAPPAAQIDEMTVQEIAPVGLQEFTIRESERRDRPTVRVSPDLPVCEECLAELFDPRDARFGYPYINCTNCGPRYSVINSLPYDRPNTTMQAWPLDEYCQTEYSDPTNRRFHAQPVACPKCGPAYVLRIGDEVQRGAAAIKKTAELLAGGQILAIKGLGGYHLACDAKNETAVKALRERKFRKERPFALMVPNLRVAEQIVTLSDNARALMASPARPIVLAPAKVELAEVAPGNLELGVMLAYTPLHHLLFASGAPEILVMTSANRSSEPIAYEDADALMSLAGIADGFLIGERPIARRVDDSVARVGTFGTAVLRRGRGYAPGCVATLPTKRPVLALGGDLKNAITLVVDGKAFGSQHIGDLDHYPAFQAFEATVADLLAMYEVQSEDLTVAYDAHPQYRSSVWATRMPAKQKVAVQHHRAHIASVLAERGARDQSVIGVSFDGTGYGDDGSIWGGEFFLGSIRSGFERVASLRPATLAGGDAAAESPVQAAAGFLAQCETRVFTDPPFNFPERYNGAAELVRKNVRCFPTTSMGRLFDTAAALLGYTREITFEGQAAIWLEQLARMGRTQRQYPFPFESGEMDFRPLLTAMIEDRSRGVPIEDIARRFQTSVADCVATAVECLREKHATDTVVLSGGVFQNELLLEDLKVKFAGTGVEVWTNHLVPTNDGGVSLGQAAIAAMGAGK